LLVVIALAGCRHAAPKDQPAIHDIEIEGTKQVSAGDIKDKLLTSESSWLPFSSKHYFDPDVWKTDLRRIERYYRERGYYQAKVIESRIEPHGKEVDVHAKVEEGAPTRIGSVTIDGLDDLPDDQKQALLKQVHLNKGAIFVEDDFEGLKKKLVDTLADQGYAAGKVEGEVKVGLDTHLADISLRIEHGQRFKFGPIVAQIRNGSRVPAWRIEEQANAEMKPNDWYSLDAQREAQSRVFGMGVFGAVKVRPGDPDPTTDTVPMMVQTQESPFHSLRIGAGIGIDQKRQQVTGFGKYVDRDFMGGLRQLTLTGDAGWAWIPTAYSSFSNGGIFDVTGELQQPRFYFRDLKGDLRLEVQRNLDPAYAYYGAKAKAGVIWQPTVHLSILPSYNLELYHLESGVATLGGNAPQLLYQCPENCLLSYFEEKIEWDHRDDRQEPKHGYYFALAFQEGGGFLGGDYDYFRIEPEARGYVSFLENDRLTFALRVKAGTLLTRGSNPSPIISRFFSGGNDMRGFGSLYLSPLAVVPRTDDPSQGYYVPIGGNGLFEASFETRYTVTGPLVLATFVDTGAVTSGVLRVRGPTNVFDELQLAVGIGARYLTPIGPIRLDLAYRPDVGPALPVKFLANVPPPPASSCFGFGKARVNPDGTPRSGGAPEGQCSIQLSIGEAF
jgi:translocation and assembly module TamA